MELLELLVLKLLILKQITDNMSGTYSIAMDENLCKYCESKIKN